MQRVSRAYKAEQKQDLREYSYIWVYLGVISREAQRSAETDVEVVSFSDPSKIYNDEPFEAYYGTCEHNMCHGAGTQYFMPRDLEQVALWQGLVTEKVLSPVTFTFGEYQHLDIKGLTIDFGEFYPSKFRVSNGRYEYTYTNGKPGKWVTEDIFLNTNHITITPLEMHGGERLRIFSILFGVGFLFDNRLLISTTWKSALSHISSSLPTQTFTFTVDNTNKKFAADDPHSFVAFLQEQQEVEFDFGRDLGNGEIERIPGGILALKSWSSNDQQAKFDAVGKADYVTSKYNKGQYYENGISLYDLAEDVLIDAGLEDYVIDSYLKQIITHNPLPVETHKNLLQLIANTARAVLWEDRKGRLVIKTSFIPEITDVSSNGETDYSHVENIVDGKTTTAEYATIERDFTYADGHQYFMPRDRRNYIEHGFVSSGVSSDDGTFHTSSDNYAKFVDENGNEIVGLKFVTTEYEVERGKFVSGNVVVDLNNETFYTPKVTVEFEAKWTFFGLTLKFADVVPLRAVCHLYAEGEEIESFEVDDLDFSTTVDHDFFDVDKIEFEFTNAQPHNRIHLKRVIFGSVTDYIIQYHDLAQSPTATRAEWVRDINVHYYEYAYGTDVKSLGTVKSVVGENEKSFSKPSHDYSLSFKEIKDDEETYTKKSKLFTDSLDDVEKPSTSVYYFVPGNDYDLYDYEKVDNVEQFVKLTTVTTETVSELPTTLTQDVLYYVETDNPHVFHLYMSDPKDEEHKTISLGYVVLGTLTIIESGAYYVKYDSDTEADVEIKGIEFVIADSYVTENIKELGDDKTSQNTLIDNEDLAWKQAEWLKDHYKNDLEYTLSYRGEPAVDPDDQIYLENRYVDKNLIRVEETTISTSQGMSLTCQLKGRRVSYSETAKINTGIIGESEVAKG